MRFRFPFRKTRTQSLRRVFANGLKTVEPVTFEALKNSSPNWIISSRYTWWNIIPLNLFEQFHYVANLIFFSVCIILLFASGASSALAFFMPFLFSIFVTFVKEAVYDVFRHIQDRKINARLYTVLEFDADQKRIFWRESCSSSLRVGQIIRFVANQEFPCDVVLLASGDPHREVYLTTTNLDGETSVKTHYALTKTQKIYGRALSIHPDEIQLSDVNLFKEFLVGIEYEPPNTNLRSFEGTVFTCSTSSIAPDMGTRSPVTIENLAFRGAKLHNTEYILGLVVYTGEDTRLSMNSKKNRRKYSSREGRLNAVLTVFLITAVVLSILFTVVATFWGKNPKNFPWFLSSSERTRFSYVKSLISFVFITNYLIPVSLMLTLELQMLMNSYLITHDPELYDTKKKLGGSANTVHLADELGQVEFLFSDKTGTLTLNKMDFKACSIFSDSSLYLINEHNVSQVQKQPNQQAATGGNRSSSSYALGYDISKTVDELPNTLLDFCTVIALCHTVGIHTENSDLHEIDSKYAATSPDEIALVEGVAKLGVVLISSSPDPEIEGGRRLLIQKRSRQETEGEGDNETVEEYIIDATLEFDHARKRMSVMARHPDGTFHIHCKGAETKLLEPELCGRSTSELRTIALGQTNEFGLSGLRTLVFATRQVTAEEYQKLLDNRLQAMHLFGEERRKALNDSDMEIESDLELLAVTGVEDILQPGVKECLENLKAAGIQVWVLTGDKEETAITVSQAAGHFPEPMTLLRVTGCTEFTTVAESIFKHLRRIDARYEQNPQQNVRPLSATLEELEDVIYATVEQELPDELSEHVQPNQSKLKYVVQKMEQARRKLLTFVTPKRAKQNHIRIPGRRAHTKPGASGEALCLVVDGESLKHAVHPSLRMAFLDLCMNVTTVLCCRMSPLQKASVVQLVQLGLNQANHGRTPVTAAIGDGGNDVSMILQANVGIGLYGNEGREATRAADYVLPQFSFLQRLLLVHGHWCYHRISYTMLLYYFKCVAFVTSNIMLGFFSGYSANSWFSSLIFVLYNLTLTAMPYLFFGCFEQNLTSEQLLQNPELYRSISHNANLRLGRVLIFVLDGIWHGGVIFFSVYWAHAGGGSYSNAIFFSQESHGNYFDFSLCGGSSLVYLVVSVNLRVMVMSRNINGLVIGSLLYTLVFNVLFLMLIQFNLPPSSLDYQTYLKLVLSPAFWLLLLISVFMANLPALIWRVYSDTWWNVRARTEKQRVKHRAKLEQEKSKKSSLSVWLDKQRRSEVGLPRPLSAVMNEPDDLELEELEGAEYGRPEETDGEAQVSENTPGEHERRI